MKNLFIYFILLLGINLQAQTDTCQWLKTNAEWCYSQWSLNPNQDLAQIDVVGDTLIDNRLCSILGLSDEGVFVEETRLICFYDVDATQVFFYEQDEFKILYDFSPSLMIGDTVTFFLPSNFRFYDISSSQGAFEPSGAALRYTILDQEFVELSNDEQLRIIQTQSIPNADNEYFDLGRIIDGVGSERGLLGRGSNQVTAGWPEIFRNYESLDFDYTELEGCIITSVQDIDKSSIQVFPNPTNSILNIQSNGGEIEDVRMYSSLGQLVLEQSVRNSDVELSVGGFSAGVYVLSIRMQDGSVLNEKVIIRNYK